MATRRVVIGALPTGGYGLRVSPPGVDVFTASDDQLVFSSEWASLFPIHASGVTGFIGGSSTGFFGWPDLGYVPFGAAMYQFSGGSWTASRSIQAYGSNNGAQYGLAFRYEAAGLRVTNYGGASARAAYIVFRKPL